MSGIGVTKVLPTALATNWSLRFDYQYSFLDSFDALLTSAKTAGTTVAIHAEPHGHAARAGLIYRFGGQEDPAGARAPRGDIKA